MATFEGVNGETSPGSSEPTDASEALDPFPVRETNEPVESSGPAGRASIKLKPSSILSLEPAGPAAPPRSGRSSSRGRSRSVRRPERPSTLAAEEFALLLRNTSQLSSELWGRFKRLAAASRSHVRVPLSRNSLERMRRRGAQAKAQASRQGLRMFVAGFACASVIVLAVVLATARARSVTLVPSQSSIAPPTPAHDAPRSPALSSSRPAAHTSEVATIGTTPTRPAPPSEPKPTALVAVTKPASGVPVRQIAATAGVREPTRAPVGPSARSQEARSASRFRGSLEVKSSPQGAKVFVNGVAVGATPMVLRDVPIGSRAVRVELDGHERWSSLVRVVANERTVTTVQLRRSPTR